MAFPYRLLFLSTPVGPLGSGQGGGVELTLTNLAQELRGRGHEITVAAPAGSDFAAAPVAQIEGVWQPTAHTQPRNAPTILPDNAVLANMLTYAAEHQDQFDLIVNFAYDWLPFYLTPFFRRPLAHFVSMGSLTDGIDRSIEQVGSSYPGRLGLYTRTQAQTFPHPEMFCCLGSAIDLSLYQFQPQPGPAVVWLGRISPEKGLEDALAAAQIAGIPLKIFGKLEDQAYWERLCRDFPQASRCYGGFLSTQALQAVVRDCRALLMTPRWVEAFGNVAIEALACGVPVLAYRRGGPAEIVKPGKTGWLITPDQVPELAAAMGRIDELDRHACRQQAEQEYSLDALGNRFEAWFAAVLAGAAETAAVAGGQATGTI